MLNSLRLRLTIIFIGLAIVPIAVVGLLLSQRSYTAELNQALNYEQQVAQRVTAEVDAFRHELEGSLATLASEFRRSNELDRAQEISLLLTALGSGQYRDNFEEFAVLDPQGMETVRVSRQNVFPPEELVSRADAPEFQEPSASRDVYYSPVRFDETTGNMFMTIALPVYEPRSVQLSGVLVAELRFETVGTLISGLQVSTGQTILVVDSNSRVVASNKAADVTGNLTFQVPEQDGQTTGPNGSDVLLARNQMTMGGQNFWVIAEQPTAQALQVARDNITVAGVIIVIALLAAVGLVVLVVNQVVRPIEKLSEVAVAIRNGDLTQRAKVGRADEIGELALAFNEMTSQLSTSITTLEQNVDQLQRTQKERERLIRELESALIFKDQFLATMSHELRTPMNAIIGYTGIALTREGVPDSVRNMLERTKVNSNRLLSLINDILDISRINAGRVEIVMRKMNLHDVAQGWYNDSKRQAQDKNLELTFSLDPNLPRYIIGDEERLTQITSNLLNNAIKFTDEGKVTLSVGRKDNDLVVTVTDSGIGIPETWQHLIFEEFRQVDASSKRRHGGAGLGLSIVQKLCVLMGGTVTVSSKMGEGSIFTVTLPLKETSETGGTDQAKEKSEEAIYD